MFLYFKIFIMVGKLRFTFFLLAPCCLVFVENWKVCAPRGEKYKSSATGLKCLNVLLELEGT